MSDVLTENVKDIGQYADQVRRGRLGPGFETGMFGPNRAAIEEEPTAYRAVRWLTEGRK